MNNKLVVPMMILMFAVAVGAGVVTGKLASRPVTTPAVIQHTTDRGTLSDVLRLSATQRGQMQEIWEKVRNTSNECIDQAKGIQHDQDDALKALLTPEQLAKYSQLTLESKGKVDALEAKRKAAFKKAVDETDKILDESQKDMYHQLIRDRTGFLPGGNAGVPN